jgi:hypothetical protein
MYKPINGSKLTPIILLSSCAVFIASLFLSQCQFLTNISLNLSEAFVFPIYICAFIMPVEVVLIVTNWIRSRIHKSDFSKSHDALNLISIATFLLTIGIAIFVFNGVTTEGAYSNISKCMVHNDCYIKVHNQLLKVSKKDYSKTINGRTYDIAYTWNKLIPNQYTITKIAEIR